MIWILSGIIISYFCQKKRQDIFAHFDRACLDLDRSLFFWWIWDVISSFAGQSSGKLRIHQRRPVAIVGSIILMSSLVRKSGYARIATRRFKETSTQPETSVTKGFALSNGGWKISGLPSDCVTYQTGRNSGDSSFYYGRDGYSRPEVRFYTKTC